MYLSNHIQIDRQALVFPFYAFMIGLVGRMDISLGVSVKFYLKDDKNVIFLVGLQYFGAQAGSRKNCCRRFRPS